MKQVFAIHGGNSFPTHEEYFAWLNAKVLDDPRHKNSKGWRALLGEHLGSEYEVVAPRMPNGDNARYVEWKIWFEKHFPYMPDGVLLVGHSLGASFLARYLSENKVPKVIGGVFLVAGPFTPYFEDMVPEFCPPASLQLLSEQGGALFMYHSKDDTVVSFSEGEKYHAALPTATYRIFDNRGHFLGDEFPEIIADIKSLA